MIWMIYSELLLEEIISLPIHLLLLNEAIFDLMPTYELPLSESQQWMQGALQRVLQIIDAGDHE